MFEHDYSALTFRVGICLVILLLTSVLTRRACAAHMVAPLCLSSCWATNTSQPDTYEVRPSHFVSPPGAYEHCSDLVSDTSWVMKWVIYVRTYTQVLQQALAIDKLKRTTAE